MYKKKTKEQKLQAAIENTSLANYVTNYQTAVSAKGVTYLIAQIISNEFIDLHTIYPLCSALFLKDIKGTLKHTEKGLFLYLCFNQDVIK